jgi:hypothetical protein
VRASDGRHFFSLRSDNLGLCCLDLSLGLPPYETQHAPPSALANLDEDAFAVIQIHFLRVFSH